MLRITQSISAAAAERYFREELQVADYYADGQTVGGYWGGKGAESLGLCGPVHAEGFTHLLRNEHPVTGDRLTARNDEDRRPGYDFTFSVPKSVSVYLAETRDAGLRSIVHQSVKETMSELEAEMKTRVRKSGADEDRTTGNMVWAAFEHDTTRPVDGVPDPHLHLHVYAMNTTFDPVENRWKAGQFGEIKRDGPYWQAVFETRLAEKSKAAGFGITRTEKGWELAGVRPETIARFSKRTAEIDDLAKTEVQSLNRKARAFMKERPGLTFRDALAEAKATLGAKTRESKRKGMSPDLLRQYWRLQMEPSELTALRVAKQSPSQGLMTQDDAIKAAIAHTFERRSVASEREFLAAAMMRGVGNVRRSDLETAVRQSKHVIRKEQAGRMMMTTRAVLAEENAIIEVVRRGMGVIAPPKESWVIQRDYLNAEQRAAVEHILTSSDRFTAVRGAAGTGKTTMMVETCEAIEARTGKQVFPLAPSSEAVEVLRRDGIESHSQALQRADTVQQLLANKTMQRQVEGQVMWIDEAGLMSSKDFRRLAEFAQKNRCRVILSGDGSQHRAVERGDLLRMLEKETAIKTAQLVDIRRQKALDYRKAVQALSESKPTEGFDLLETMGAIREVEDSNQRCEQLAASFLAKSEAGQTALVVAPTHAEGRAVTEKVRSLLREKGLIGPADELVSRLHNLGWTEPQRQDAVNYHPGQVVEFHQNAKGFGRGQKWEVREVRPDEVLVSLVGEKECIPLPVSEAEKFAVYDRQVLGLAVGDSVRITQNVMSADGKHRLKNNSLHRIESIEDGSLTLALLVGKDGKAVTLDISKGAHLTHGVAVTSYASQGKTVDHVLISQSTASFSVASREQFYVSASRGRLGVEVYTDSKALLREAVQASDARQNAHELLRGEMPGVQLHKSAKQSRDNRSCYLAVPVMKMNLIHPLHTRPHQALTKKQAQETTQEQETGIHI